MAGIGRLNRSFIDDDRSEFVDAVVCILWLSQTLNATQMNQPWEIVAFSGWAPPKCYTDESTVGNCSIFWLGHPQNATQIKQPGIIVAFSGWTSPQNATQMNKPWEIVAFEELGGFENIGEERVLATSGL